MSAEHKSTLVNCPICGKSTPEWYINQHLDKDCAGSGEPASAEDAFEQRTQPAKRTRLSHTGMESAPRPSPSQPSATHTYTPSAPAPISNRKAAAKPITSSVMAAMPLAEQVRPEELSTFVGQADLMGEDGILRNLILQDKVPSMILWGPPGSGKTTSARIIARLTKARFLEMGGVTHGVADVRKAMEEARQILQLTGQKTILFLDEIHRFNKAQQDLFLPFVERGTVTLIGATTENPSFKVNGALLSRCRVFVLQRLSEDELYQILDRALLMWRERHGHGMSTSHTNGHDNEKAQEDEIKVLKQLALISDGDARNALNILDLALSALEGSHRRLVYEDIKKAFQKSHILYDRAGDEHYNAISALHKAIRGSDANAALYWLGRMLVGGEDPLYVARRLVRCASEDIGLADNQALPLAVATYQACQLIGMPECDAILAHLVVYLSEAKKSVRAYMAYELVKKTIREEPAYPVPLHIRNAPTKLMKDLGYGKDYKYNPAFEEPVEQEYLPSELKRRRYLDVKEVE